MDKTSWTYSISEFKSRIFVHKVVHTAPKTGPQAIAGGPKNSLYLPSSYSQNTQTAVFKLCSSFVSKTHEAMKRDYLLLIQKYFL